MIVCKFDQAVPSDTALTNGFDSFFESMLNESNTAKAHLKMRILELLGDDVS